MDKYNRNNRKGFLKCPKSNVFAIQAIKIKIWVLAWSPSVQVRKGNYTGDDDNYCL